MSASPNLNQLPARRSEHVPTVSDSEKEETDEVCLTSFHASPVGGGVAIGRGASGRLIRAVIGTGMAARDPLPGETWRFTGPGRMHQEHGWQIHATVALPLMPLGRTLVRYLATNARFPGVGWKTADRLWSEFGDHLHDLLRDRDVNALAEIIGAERAVSIVEGFGLFAEEVEVFRL